MPEIPPDETLRRMRWHPSKRPDFGPGFDDAYNEMKRRTSDRDWNVVARVLKLHVFDGLGRRNYERRALNMPHFVDRFDLELLRRQGVHAAAAMVIASANGLRGLSLREDISATPWAWINDAVRPTRGGRVINIHPWIGDEIRKVEGMFIVRATIPETVAQALGRMSGRPLETLLSHPLLDPLGLKIRRARADVEAGRLYVTTDCRYDGVAIGELGPGDFEPL